MSDHAIKIEKHMESLDLPESDRDEVRVMMEFLETRKSKTKISQKLKDWLTGKAVTHVQTNDSA